jgi:L-ascorbate metabolism protein UlaG (beta-lactamase superfamily)
MVADGPRFADAAPGGGIEGEATFVGTATLLLRVGGFTILTDPNFLHSGEKARLGMGLRSRRLTEPAMQIADLPPLDLLVLSHYHGDHFDQKARKELDKATPIVTEPHAARKLRRRGFTDVIALETWQAHEIRRGERTLSVEALPGKHSPAAMSLVVPRVMGSLLQVSERGRPLIRIYITGDTLFYDGLAEIPRRHPAIELCFIHLGGTRLAGVLLTMDDVQGVRALELVKPRVAVPVHFDDYAIFRSPLESFLTRAEGAHLSTRVREVRRGERWRFVVGKEAAA